ncbi:type II toxin-antitoxin system RelE/ParE family toxin [Flavobacterium pectinovorum]|uniref:Type II toxin-antitoxin system RelE/ParE family toxin n=1 Tax=Flavobacterium pectinovorum TaxID=29533 RepID=A0A502EME1_9FLAO|nr:type II toxin-antitoxin system RelE/ParE family toxin [Flavobacterium pectinovorum]TPG37656.1 type II toxin-antitoxin system RelE/ParE family toxin [Flavobacterium pectinovorum]
MKYFETRFLEEAKEFVSKLDKKTIAKLLYNIDLTERNHDSRLFKKLKNDIWEFRLRFGGVQIRLLAFWDKTDSKQTFIFATHGFLKKVDKVPIDEIDRANKIRIRYFENK